jgi:hypothetical protein
MVVEDLVKWNSRSTFESPLLLGQRVLTNVSEYEAGGLSVYESLGDFTERICGCVEGSATSGSRKDSKEAIFKGATRREQQPSRPTLPGGVAPPRLYHLMLPSLQRYLNIT